MAGIGKLTKEEFIGKTKICVSCKEEKEISNNFYVSLSYNNRYYPETKCKNCLNEQLRNSESRRKNYTESRKRNKEQIENKRLIKEYGIDREGKRRLLETQDNKCKICKTELLMGMDPHYVHIDHNHKTNKVRGILCTNCNRGLGCFKDNINSLYTAIDYLLDNDFNIKELLKLETKS